jgi:CheY-like chemotaxis protein
VAVALAILREQQFDLLFTDNSMPKVTGVELVKKLQAKRKIIPVVMATAVIPEHEFADSPSIKPAAVLIKPYSVAEMLRAARNVLLASGAARVRILPPNY